MGVVRVISGIGFTYQPPPVTIPLSEVFGPTIQGEGPATGRRCWFVRTGLCNLTCEWCDTPYTWDTTRYDVRAECPDTAPMDILERLSSAGATQGALVVLSGGEPLLHAHKLPHLFLGATYEWHVETNGTIKPPHYWTDAVTHTTVSPKVITRDPRKKRIKPKALAAWNELARDGLAIFKFVTKTPADVDAVAQLVDDLDLHRPSIWVMPEGITAETVVSGQRIIVPAVMRHGFNLSTRLHTLIWNEERGR